MQTCFCGRMPNVCSSGMQPLAVFRRSDALLFLKHSAEMLGVLKTETVGHLGDSFPGGKTILGKLDDEATDVVACRIARGLFDDIAKVIGRHTELVGTILHSGQTKGQLELVLEIIA